MNKVIILGTSHYNSVGLAQSLGEEGLYVIAVVVGKAGLLRKSKFVREIHEVNSLVQAIDYIAEKLIDVNPTVIIPCGDGAAIELERNSYKLREHFLYQYSTSTYSVEEAMNKKIQVQIAQSCGLDVPLSYEVDNIDNIPSNMIYPCIIKPLLSCEGDKRNITVVTNESEMHRCVSDMLEETQRLIVQQFIENKDKELNILGCSFIDGNCEIPLSIEKVRTYPKGRGSVSVGRVLPLDNATREITSKIAKMVRSLGYVGLFSVELIVDNTSNRAYFIEMNLRNDALNPFIVKGGVNLPFLHYQNLNGQQLKKYSPIKKPKQMICEPVHMASLYHRGISFYTWLKDVVSSPRFILYNKNDKGVFFHEIIKKIKR